MYIGLEVFLPESSLKSKHLQGPDLQGAVPCLNL